MLAFSGGTSEATVPHRYAAIAGVVSGHVLILDADSRKPVDCLRTSPGAGGARQAHAIWPTPDGRWLLVANQNGKLLERIRTDWEARSFSFDTKLSLYEGTTPSGALRQHSELRPDNAPICPRTTDDGRFTFVTLRGGGAFVVDHASAPMRIVAEYDKAHVGDNGCGLAQVGDKVYLNAGAGAPGRPDASELRVVDLGGLRVEGTEPNLPQASLVYSREGDVDAHGIAATRDGQHVLVTDRTENDVTVVHTATDTVVSRFGLAGAVSTDPAPDLLDMSPAGDVMFASLRGPSPLSGGHDAVGATPGIGVISLTGGGTSGTLTAVATARRSDGASPDPHAIRVRVLSP